MGKRYLEIKIPRLLRENSHFTFFFFSKDICLKSSNTEKQGITENQTNEHMEIIFVFIENTFSTERITEDTRKNHKNIFNSILQYQGYATFSYIVR